jgi:hypothetical protein
VGGQHGNGYTQWPRRECRCVKEGGVVGRTCAGRGGDVVSKCRCSCASEIGKHRRRKVLREGWLVEMSTGNLQAVASGVEREQV